MKTKLPATDQEKIKLLRYALYDESSFTRSCLTSGRSASTGKQANRSRKKLLTAILGRPPTDQEMLDSDAGR